MKTGETAESSDEDALLDLERRFESGVRERERACSE